MKLNFAKLERWDERDLIRRLCHALDIASRAIDHLAPAGFTDTSHPDGTIRPEKVIAETAVLLHGAALAVHHHEVNSRIHRVARQLAPHARSPRIRLGLTLHPALAFDYSLAHVLLTHLGYPDPAFDRLLDHARAAHASGGRERMPHRALELAWIESLRSEALHLKPRRSASIARAARKSILAQPIDVFSSTDEDLYALTHAVMYATGLALAPGALPRSRAAILAEAEAALIRCLDAEDYDLAGEILLAWPLTGKSWTPAAAFAFRVLAAVEDKAGFLPTPATRLSELRTREGADRSRYLFGTAYHTAYVMGLLCAAALQPACAPPTALLNPHRSRGAVHRILPLLNQAGSVPHWRWVFAKLDVDETEALAGFIFSVVLHRKAAARDFAGLSQALRLGAQLGITTTPAASQAAELLNRLAVCADGLSAEKSGDDRTPPSEQRLPLPFGFAVVSAAPQTTLAAR